MRVGQQDRRKDPAFTTQSWKPVYGREFSEFASEIELLLLENHSMID
jgi:hypothetical protein